MKKLTARQFQHGFGKITEELKPGQVVVVTKRGKPHGVFTKAGPRRRKAPDFAANLKDVDYSRTTGQKLIDQICDDILS